MNRNLERLLVASDFFRKYAWPKRRYAMRERLRLSRNLQSTVRFELLEDRHVLAVDIPPLFDINAIPNLQGSNPSEFVDVGGVVFFSAATALSGNELWKSDGTSAGTVLVKYIRSGSDSANPNSLTNIKGTLFFRATSGFQF